MVLATHWAIFSQKHPVTLAVSNYWKLAQALNNVPFKTRGRSLASGWPDETLKKTPLNEAQSIFVEIDAWTREIEAKIPATCVVLQKLPKKNNDPISEHSSIQFRPIWLRIPKWFIFKPKTKFACILEGLGI
jgi:hypothetical protein